MVDEVGVETGGCGGEKDPTVLFPPSLPPFPRADAQIAQHRGKAGHVMAIKWEKINHPREKSFCGPPPTPRAHRLGDTQRPCIRGRTVGTVTSMVAHTAQRRVQYHSQLPALLSSRQSRSCSGRWRSSIAFSTATSPNSDGVRRSPASSRGRDNACVLWRLRHGSDHGC